MIQRVFYRGIGRKPDALGAHDMDAREHVALWPVVVLFLVMGVASPLWLRAIDVFGVAQANADTSPVILQATPTATIAAAGTEAR
jgi:NADH-quinone oxidoreductase subunit M